MAERKIPDRSDEPALQESLDHGKKCTTASNSDAPKNDVRPDTRDDEGNSTDKAKTADAE
jgi:hypothetical protein